MKKISMKSQAHIKFDRLWRHGFMTRKEAYLWLSYRLGIPEDECHIRFFNSDQYRRAIRHSEKAFLALMKKQDTNLIPWYQI
jgi:succinate dehydrogenase flavin-adding protein (antitoxin of CptAB toxin-antitoxin module)